MRAAHCFPPLLSATACCACRTGIRAGAPAISAAGLAFDPEFLERARSSATPANERDVEYPRATASDASGAHPGVLSAASAAAAELAAGTGSASSRDMGIASAAGRRTDPSAAFATASAATGLPTFPRSLSDRSPATGLRSASARFRPLAAFPPSSWCLFVSRDAGTCGGTASSADQSHR